MTDLRSVVQSVLANFLAYFEEAVEVRNPAKSLPVEWLRMAEAFDKIIDELIQTRVDTVSGQNKIYVIRNLGDETENYHERTQHYIKIIRALYGPRSS